MIIEYLLIGEIIYIVSMVVELVIYREKSLLMSNDGDFVDIAFSLIIITGMYIVAWPIMVIGNIIYIISSLRESN